MGLVTFLGVVLALLIQAPPDQVAPAPAQLDVVVRDARGVDLETLTARDFTVVENGVSLTVIGARFVRPEAPPTVVAQPVAIKETSIEDRAGGDARLFGIFLDEYSVTAGPRADAARDALARWVREALRPGDLVVVLKPLDSLLTIALTDDREAAARAIESFQPRRGDYVPRTTFEQNFIAGAPASIEATRAQVVSSSLNALVTHFARFASVRKSLIVLSEGLTRTGTRRGDGELPGSDAVSLSANRAHVAVYAIDPSEGSAAGAADAGTTDVAQRARERLVALTRDTTGAVVAPPMSVRDGLTQLLRDASGYYVLSVLPANWRPAGQLHAVDVTVRRAGVTVRARRGYWSPSDMELRPPATLEAVLRSATSARVVPRRMSPLIRPWFGMSRAADGSTRVDFVWEPAPRVPGDRTVRPVPSRVSLSVSTPDGTPVFNGVVTPSISAADVAGAQSRAFFASSTRRLVVEMSIQDATARVVDTDVRDLLVGQFSGPIAIGTPEVLRARTAREFTLLSRDVNAAPVASRSFSRTERLVLRLPVSVASGQANVSARLFSEIGGVMRPLPVTLLDARSQLFQTDLSLAVLPAGGYAIEFVARAGGAEATERLAFRITP